MLMCVRGGPGVAHGRCSQLRTRWHSVSAGRSRAQRWRWSSAAHRARESGERQLQSQALPLCVAKLGPLHTIKKLDQGPPHHTTRRAEPSTHHFRHSVAPKRAPTPRKGRAPNTREGGREGRGRPAYDAERRRPSVALSLSLCVCVSPPTTSAAVADTATDPCLNAFLSTSCCPQCRPYHGMKVSSFGPLLDVCRTRPWVVLSCGRVC